MIRMRSVMFVPASRPELAVKAASSKADVICLDLEDGVAPDDKVNARLNLASMAGNLRAGDMPCWLRVNSELDSLLMTFDQYPRAFQLLCYPRLVT